MKISEMTNDQATEAMIRLSTAFSAICEDEAMLGIVDELQNMGNTPLLKAIPKLLPKFVTLAFVKHKNHLYEIVGALCQKTVQQVGEMNFKETVALVKDSYDEILHDFFSSSVPSRQKSGVE